MENVLIVSSKENTAASIVPLIKEAFSNNCKISMLKSGLELRRAAANGCYDFVIINCPLSDEFGIELSSVVVQANHLTGCVLLVKAELADEAARRVENEGIVVIPKPLNRSVFYQAIKFITVTNNRMQGILSENVKLQNKIEEIRLINRAKLLLMQYLKFDENQAHRYIEKHAMDSRCTKREVAVQVIRTYEV